jgi:hypothetical protein
MPKDFINDPTHWRKRADETRELADDEARKRLSKLATEFDRIALRVEDRMSKTGDGR